MLLSMAVTVVNAGETAEIKDGDILCRVNFNDNENFTHTKLATSNGTVTYTESGDGFSAVFKNANETGVQTQINSFKLADHDVYTIDFAEGETIDSPTGRAAYIKVNTSGTTFNQFGLMYSSKSPTDDTKSFVNNGTNKAKYGYGTNNFTPYTEKADGVEYLFYRVVVNVKEGTMKIYVLNSAGNYTLAEGTEFSGLTFGVEYLTLKMTSVSTTTAGQKRAWKDIIVYKGDRNQSTTFNVNRDGYTKTESITNGMYTLPNVNKAGYVFAGWKVNDAATLTPAGAKIPDATLAKIDAVFEKVMSKTWVQFKTNAEDATKKDIRIVGAIDTLDYVELRYKVVVTAGEKVLYDDDVTITKVYSSLTETYSANESKDITVKDLGYSDGYMVSFAIKGIKGEITVTLTPSQTTGLGTTTGEEISFTVNVDTETVN